MRNKLMIIGIMICLVISFCTIVQATEETTAIIRVNKSEVKAGETFTVTLSANCADGINGIDTKFSYDNTKLELISGKVIDSSKWSSLGSEEEITIICNSPSKITTADIYEVTFKVKDNVEEGKIEIATTEIILDSDSAIDSEHTIEAQKIAITVVKENSENPGGQDTPVNPGGQDTPVIPGETQNPTNPGNNSASNGNNGLTVNIGGNASKEPTKASGALPYAGINIGIIIAAIVTVGIAVLIYTQYRKLNDIK